MSGEARIADARALGIEVVAMAKHFGDFTALDSVSLRVKPGTVHALLGENGAGKSTLVKCIMGYYHPDDGDVIVGQHGEVINNPRDAHGMGLGMVYQHFTLIPGMTVMENLVMARSDVPTVIDWPRERSRLEAFLSRVPFKVDLDALVAHLAAGEKQKVEILKQLYLDCRFLILDEPTSVLTPVEADEILGLIRDMAHAGEITVLMITHKFREVMAFADEVSVLRRGRLVGGGHISALTPDDLARLMIGDEVIPEAKTRSDEPPGDVRLELRGLEAENDRGEIAVRSVDLDVRGGEIVGIAGVSGNGQAELVQVLAGQRDAVAGDILVHGEPYRATRAEMRRHRVFCLPEEPLRNACVPNMSVADNLAFRLFDREPFAAAGVWLRRSAFSRKAKDLIALYNIKASSAQALIGTLSGGNVQRAVLARELSGEVDVLVAANPCFGLDFSAVADIRGQIMDARNRGAAVLLVDEDLDELFELADRVVVMSEGRIAYETPVADADRTVIGYHMAGHG